jgi:hypothetical protein
MAGVRAFAGEEMPKELRAYDARRTGDIVLVTDPPRVFATPSLPDRLLAGARLLLGGDAGAHGFSPEIPEMGALFLAMGRGVPHGGQIGPQRAVDVAPTVARLLGIDPPLQSDGRPIPEISALQK